MLTEILYNSSHLAFIVTLLTLGQDVTVNRKGNQFSLTSSRRPPALLHTSREARAKALQFYGLSFGLSAEDIREMSMVDEELAPDISVLDEVPARIYFNRNADRVHFVFQKSGRLDTSLFIVRCLVIHLELRSIALNVNDFNDEDRSEAVCDLAGIALITARFSIDWVEELVLYSRPSSCFVPYRKHGKIELCEIDVGDEIARVMEQVEKDVDFVKDVWENDAEIDFLEWVKNSELEDQLLLKTKPIENIIRFVALRVSTEA